MATIPRNTRSLTAAVLDFGRKRLSRRNSLTPEQAHVADWLRGNVKAMESIRNLLAARTEGRALSPIPSNPTDALIDKARDYEVRSILAELVGIFESPLPSLQDTGDEGE